MLKSQELAIEINKLLIEINKLPFEMKSDDPHLELRRSERETLQNKLMSLRQQEGAALESEATRTAGAFGEDAGEHRERQQVTGKADLGVLVGALVSRRALGGGLGRGRSTSGLGPSWG